MNQPISRAFSRRTLWAGLLAASGVTVLGCGSTTDDLTGSSNVTVDSASSGTVFDPSVVHEFSISYEQEAYDTMIAAYLDSAAKDWMTGSVTIDGTDFAEVGFRLKGNSSLRGITADSDPADLPWLIRLDKYVDDAELDGYREFVVRSNTTESALNEIVALGLLSQAGLASTRAIATSLTAGGGEPQLRLVVQNLDDIWDKENFSTAGILYKAESTGDYSYRGDDAASYEDVFDQETDTKNEDLAPLIAFLKFINESTDDEFDSQLSEHLDVDSFATYLAFEELVDNFDDIDGPGNNSFLRYDSTERFTLVAWDHNLAFGTKNGAAGTDGGRGGGQPGGDQPRGERPDGDQAAGRGEPPAAGEDAPAGDENRAGAHKSNILVERFAANADFAALKAKASADLKTSLYTSGAADTLLDTWSTLLTKSAPALIMAETIASDADAIRKIVDA